jgi:hypothetical protein
MHTQTYMVVHIWWNFNQHIVFVFFLGVHLHPLHIIYLRPCEYVCFWFHATLYYNEILLSSL